MQIKGVQKLSLIDYPGKLCATLFVPGCDFRCGYCYNSSLVLHPEKLPIIPEEEILDFLKERKSFLDAVCFTGGEPCIQPDLTELIKKIKNLNYLVKIDTNGSRPERLEDWLGKNLVDYIAMDIKAPLEKYETVAGVKINIEKIQESINILKSSKIDYEFRTTVVPDLLGPDDLIKIAEMLRPAQKYVLQQFLPKTCIDKSFEGKRPYSEDKLKEFQKVLKPYFETCELRL
jgi:pyruvate formate lyase activating enzyme